MTELEDRVRGEVGKVLDPETGQSFAEMQTIINVREEESGIIRLEFIPTSPFCSLSFGLASDIKAAALKVLAMKKKLVTVVGI